MTTQAKLVNVCPRMANTHWCPTDCTFVRSTPKNPHRGDPARLLRNSCQEWLLNTFGYQSFWNWKTVETLERFVLGAIDQRTQAVLDGLNKLEEDHCVCGARRDHRARPNWAYCVIHEKIDWLREHFDGRLNLQGWQPSETPTEGLKFFWPDRDNPDYGWICVWRNEAGSQVAHALDYVKRANHIGPPPGGR